MSYYQMVELSDALKALDAANARSQALEQALREMLAINDRIAEMNALPENHERTRFGMQLEIDERRKAAWAAASALVAPREDTKP